MRFLTSIGQGLYTAEGVSKMKGKVGLKKERSSERIALKTSFSRFTNKADDPVYLDAESGEDAQHIEGQSHDNNVTNIAQTSKRGPKRSRGPRLDLQSKKVEPNKGVVGDPPNANGIASSSEHGLKRNRGGSITEQHLKAQKGEEVVRESRKAKVTSKQTVQEDDDFVQRPPNVCNVGVAKKRKTNAKNEDLGVQSIRTRSSPHSLWMGLTHLSKKQKKAVTKWGFEKLLGLIVNGIPSLLGFYVVDKFDSKTMSIKVEGGSIAISKERIHKLTGLPIGGARIVKTEARKGIKEISKRWRGVYEGVKEVSATNIANRIEAYDQVDWMFKLDFVMLLITTMIECQKNGKCLMSYLPLFKPDIDIKKLDWCDLVVRSLKECKEKWKRDDPEDYFLGPLTILTLFYVDATSCNLMSGVRTKMALEEWNFNKLKERQEIELKDGGFGRGKIRELYGEKVDEELANSGDYVMADAYVGDEGQEGIRLPVVDDLGVGEAGQEKSLQNISELEGNTDIVEHVVEGPGEGYDGRDNEDEGLGNGSNPAMTQIKRMEDLLRVMSDAIKEFEGGVGELLYKDPCNEDVKKLMDRYKSLFGKQMNNPQEQLSQIWRDEEWLEQVFRSCDTAQMKKKKAAVDSECLVGSVPSFSLGLTQHFGGCALHELDGDNVVLDDVGVEGPCRSPVDIPREENVGGDEVGGEVVFRTPIVVGASAALDSDDEHVPLDVIASRINGKAMVMDRPKRVRRAGYACRSPYADRPVNINKKEAKPENDVWRYLWQIGGPLMELIFHTQEGRSGFRSWFESLQPNMNVNSNVVDCWSLVLNKQEDKRGFESPYRLFCGCTVIVSLELVALLYFKHVLCGRGQPTCWW